VSPTSNIIVTPMKPIVKIATALTHDGGEMVLYEHDRDFLIKINGHDLMHSCHHGSELELARLGCAHLTGRKASSMLIGGLGMGYIPCARPSICSAHKPKWLWANCLL
jgi:hypothetical protein